MKFKFSFNNFFSWLLIIIFLVAGLFLVNNNFSKNLDTNEIKFVKIADQKLKVDLATTSLAQEKGLSGRNKLNENEGMLFIFDHIDKYSFWMKDMNFPIDIIWISNDLRVVYIKENATPGSFPEAFTPNVDVRYVLEVSAFFSKKNNLKIGDSVGFLSS